MAACPDRRAHELLPKSRSRLAPAKQRIRGRLLITIAAALSFLSLTPGLPLATEVGPSVALASEDEHRPSDDGQDRDRFELNTSVVSTSVPGPSAPMSSVRAKTGTCNDSAVLVGGGVLTSGSTSSALHLNGSLPSTASGTLDPASSQPTRWTGVAATGGQLAISGATTTAFGICLADGPTRIRIFETHTDGPTAAEAWTRTTASCPNHSVLVGGGAKTDPETVGSLKPIGSFPSDASGNPVTDTAINPTSWTAVGLNGGQPAPGAVTRAFVMCAPARAVSTQIAALQVGGPLAAGTSLAATVARLGTGAKLLFGGGMFVSAGGGIPQTGVHLRGTFPSDSSGNPVSSGRAGAWTGVVQTGGQPAPGTTTSVFAVCANPRRPEVLEDSR